MRNTGEIVVIIPGWSRAFIHDGDGYIYIQMFLLSLVHTFFFFRKSTKYNYLGQV